MSFIANTTNLAGHLKREHGITASDNPEGQKQHTIQSMLSKSSSAPLTRTKKKAIDEALQNYVIHTLVPLGVAENPYFKALLKECEPSYDVPCCKTLKIQLQERHASESAKIKDDIKNLQHVAITHDSWTSVANINYETVTCHFISSDDHLGCWKLQNVVLQTTPIEGSHNADNISAFLRDVQKTWGLPNGITAVTDNASVEVKAFQDLGWERFGCLGHTINLVVRAALKDKTATKLISKGRALVSYFHHSPLATRYLEEKQNLLSREDEVKSYRLINDVCTRWNSTLDMLGRLSLLMPAIHAVSNDPKIKIKDLRAYLYTFEDQKVVEDLIQMLKPFKMATEILSGESTPTLSYILPTLIKLYACLEERDGDEPVVKKLKEAMRSDLKRRLEPNMQKYEIASVLDPSTKAMAVIQVQGIKERLHLEASQAQVNIKKEPEDAAEASPQPPLPAMSVQGIPIIS